MFFLLFFFSGIFDQFMYFVGIAHVSAIILPAQEGKNRDRFPNFYYFLISTSLQRIKREKVARLPRQNFLIIIIGT